MTFTSADHNRLYEAQLVSQVVESLAMHMMDNAKFMAERLHAEFPSENNAYLLGTCNYWCDKAYSAYEVLRGCTSPQSRYMFALSCLKLGKYNEAEKALESNNAKVPNGAYGQFLLGRISKLQNRHDKAIHHFKQALALNPMMWTAYEELCALGAFETADAILGSNDALTRQTVNIHDIHDITAEAQAREATASGTDAAPASVPTLLDPGAPPPDAPGAITERTLLGPQLKAPLPVPGKYPQDLDVGLAMLRSPEKQTSAATAMDEGTVDGSEKVAGGWGHAAGALAPALPMLELSAGSLEGQGAVVRLLQALGKGHRLLAQFKAAEAVEAFAELPCQHYQTAWVLSQVGRAYFEMVDYSKACHFFTWSRNQDPYRLEGLEWYSTVLWHMKREVELSHLAQDALSLDRLCPQAWCVLGNCFSLQKEHETALRFFQRALQIDPHFTYAYTLCGHEYFANEDFDKSLAFYRNAITRDPRHYNAWYGIGQIYYRQEKYDMAINNFKHALSINPRSSVLTCYLGMACHKQGYISEALEWLQHAIQADEQNPLARFEHASVLIGQEKYEEAIIELEKLKDIAPREASVYFQMGRIYKKLKQPDKALTHFCYAMDLKPTSTDQNLIKSAIEKLHVDDDEVDEEI